MRDKIPSSSIWMYGPLLRHNGLLRSADLSSQSNGIGLPASKFKYLYFIPVSVWNQLMKFRTVLQLTPLEFEFSSRLSLRMKCECRTSTRVASECVVYFRPLLQADLGPTYFLGFFILFCPLRSSLLLSKNQICITWSSMVSATISGTDSLI